MDTMDTMDMDMVDLEMVDTDTDRTPDNWSIIGSDMPSALGLFMVAYANLFACVSSIYVPAKIIQSLVDFPVFIGKGVGGPFCPLITGSPSGEGVTRMVLVCPWWL